MLINEVCSKVGLTRKSIRYYEQEGLLTPSRTKENDYRNYQEKDIKRLKTIKFLRELGVPIKEIKNLMENKISIEECLKEQIKKIEKEEVNYQKAKNMCEEIVKKGKTLEELDERYMKEMNILNKEGFTLREKEKDHKKKIRGAILSSLLFSAFFVFMIITISYFQLTEEEKIPWVIYGIVIMIFTLPMIGIIVNLKARIKEIKGGEEDEASKY